MVPRLLIDSATIPGSAGVLKLFRRGDEWSIMLAGNELMNSRLSGSEEALATLACARMRERARPHVLVGGLGMGFTLRAALAVLPQAARVTVAELVPGVIVWAQGEMAPLFAGSLDDARVTLRDVDVADVIAGAPEAYDAILLDVDNGPDGLTRRENDRLYAPGGLAAARAALRPGGVLAVWSSAPDPRFAPRLTRAGFVAEEVVARARGTRGARHVIWLAVRPG